MSTIYTDAPEAIAVVQAAFPQYKHAPSRLTVQPFHPITPTSYWSGGTKDLWAIAKLDGTQASGTVRENGHGFTEGVGEVQSLPEGCALVRLTIGNRESAALYVPADNLAKLLPAPIALTDDEKVVLVATASLVSSARNRVYTAHRMGTERVTATIASLVTKGLMAKNKSVTTNGRNAANSIPEKNEILWKY